MSRKIKMDGLASTQFSHYKPRSNYHGFLEAKQAYIGRVDFGGVMIVDSEKMTREAIGFMFDELTGKWKCSIRYYLTDDKSAAILCQMMKLAFQIADSKCLTCS